MPRNRGEALRIEKHERPPSRRNRVAAQLRQEPLRRETHGSRAGRIVGDAAQEPTELAELVPVQPARRPVDKPNLSRHRTSDYCPLSAPMVPNSANSRKRKSEPIQRLLKFLAVQTLTDSYDPSYSPRGITLASPRASSP
ncbi:MAG: hypothetical protein [Microviridae sp.]|nr:MAG: hypothetical protein [Microviridae sp.]